MGAVLDHRSPPNSRLRICPSKDHDAMLRTLSIYDRAASEKWRATVKRHPELPPLRHAELPPPSSSCCRLKVGSAADGTEGGGADRRAVSGGAVDEAALSLGAEPVAVAADGQHVA